MNLSAGRIEEQQQTGESRRSFSLRWAKNSIFYFASQLAGKGLFFLTTVYLARLLGASEYGKFAFAFGFVTLFSVITKFGLDLLTSRDVGENPQLAAQYFTASLTLRTLLSFVFLFLMLIGILIFNKESEVNRLILLLAISAALQSIAGASTSLFEALQSFVYRSILNVLMYGVIFLALLAATTSNPALDSVGPAFLIGTVLYCVTALSLCHFKVARLSLPRDMKFLWRLFKLALPLGLTEIFIGIYYRVDTVLLSLFTTDEIVGWYDAAYTFVYGLRLLPVTAGMVLLPGLSNLYSKEPQKAAGIYRLTMYYSIAFGLWITFLIAMNSTQLVSLVFGPGFAASSSVLSLLIWTCVIMFANAFQGILLVVTQQRAALFRATALGAISNIVLNLILIPAWDMYGASVATVLSEFCVFLVCAGYLRRFVSVTSFLRFIFAPLLGVLLMATLWFYFGKTNFLLASLLCTLGYFGVFLALRRFGLNEVMRATR
ncbi:flippase [bacterium]|nr:flippase [bacterium]MCI0604268.1 flippase [bacterium]